MTNLIEGFCCSLIIFGCVTFQTKYPMHIFSLDEGVRTKTLVQIKRTHKKLLQVKQHCAVLFECKMVLSL